MDKYLQDRAWSMLPCKYREEVKRLYDEFKDVSDRYKDVPCLSDADRRSSDRNIGHLAAMRAVFGEHNLTAEEEPEVEHFADAGKMFDSFIRQTSREHDRLHIAAMLAQSFVSEMYLAPRDIPRIVTASLGVADALIAAVKEGGSEHGDD